MMHFLKSAMIGGSACLLLAACAGGSDTDVLGAAEGSPDAGDDSWIFGPDGPPHDFGPWNPPPGRETGEGCDPLAEYIYAVTSWGELYAFWPPSLTFQLLGTLKYCYPHAVYPISMAVDQHATAWVHDEFGGVYRVDLASGKCTETPYIPPASGGIFRNFGMAFAQNSSSPSGESLYVREGFLDAPEKDALTRKLGVFDTTTFTIFPLGEGAGQNGDLTGTADGRLFGLVKQPGQSAVLTEFNTLNGAAITNTPLSGVTLQDTWALAAWGGEIWLFTAKYEGPVDVYRFDPSNGVATPALQVPGFDIVGAGVSTCAPISPPH